MKNDVEIGNRIRNIREGLRLSRESFSEMVNISESFLAKIETGNKSLSIDTLMTICHKTGSSTDYILFGNIPNNTNIQRVTKMLSNSNEETISLIYNITRSIYHYKDKITK